LVQRALALAAVFCAPSVVLAASIEIGPGSLVASIRDAAGRPLSGARVVADGPTTREAQTGLAGIVALSALPLGTYALVVTQAGYAPWTTSVVVRAAAGATPSVVNVRLEAATFSDLASAASPVSASALDAGHDPVLAHVLTALPAALPGEARVELDGIPLAGGAAAGLRVRSALSLDDVEFVEAPSTESATPHDAAGGILNERTPAIAGAPAGGFETGYDTAFGTFEHARFSDTLGGFGLLADAVTGEGLERSQTLKLRYAFAPSVSFGFASYGTQSAQGSAPAYAADVRAGLAGGMLQARVVGSALEVTAGPSARENGLQAGYTVAVGANTYDVSFAGERDAATSPGGGPALVQRYTTAGARGTFALSPLARLELGDAFSEGTALGPRNDPQAAITLRATSTVTLRVAAGSAFATATSGALGPPETSLGYRASADAALGDRDHLRVSAFDLRRSATFAFADAQASGFELSFERRAVPGRLGGAAYVDLARTGLLGPRASAPLFGSAQTARELATSAPVGGEPFGDPYSKARLALDYGINAFDLRCGTTLLGAGNALGPRALLLGDASLRVRALDLLDLRIGVENAFGAAVSDPLLAPLYPPRELTVTFGRLGE
jgi:hypothetical protein